MRSKISGVQIPTAAKLNIDGEFTLDASAGTSGQVMISQGSGNTPSWTSSPTFSTLTADQVLATNNGNGTNFKVGDDVWLGDINVANTMSLKGQQSATSGYIRFGGDSNAFGYDGTKLSYAGNLTTAGLTLSSITLPSAVAGATEYDGTFKYFTPNTTSGRGITPNDYYYSITSDATYTITAGTAQKMFPSMTNGLGLDVSAMYEFEINAIIAIATLSPGATGSNTLVLDTAFSTPTAYSSLVYSNTYATLNSTSGIGSSLTYASLPAPSAALTPSMKYVSTATAATLVTSVGSVTATYSGVQNYAGNNVGIRIKGTVNTSATSGAKLLPHVRFTNASGGSVGAKILSGSYVKVRRITNNTSNGSW